MIHFLGSDKFSSYAIKGLSKLSKKIIVYSKPDKYIRKECLRASIEN